MSRPILPLVLLAAFAGSFVVAQQVHSQAPGPEITVSFAFPDGSAKSASVTLREAEQLTGERPIYMLLPFVVAALRKLELAYETETDAKGIKISGIGAVADGPLGEWVYGANGFPSPYRLDTQTIEGITRVEFSYRASGSY